MCERSGSTVQRMDDLAGLLGGRWNPSKSLAMRTSLDSVEISSLFIELRPCVRPRGMHREDHGSQTHQPEVRCSIGGGTRDGRGDLRVEAPNQFASASGLLAQARFEIVFLALGESAARHVAQCAEHDNRAQPYKIRHILLVGHRKILAWLNSGGTDIAFPRVEVWHGTNQTALMDRWSLCDFCNRCV